MKKVIIDGKEYIEKSKVFDMIYAECLSPDEKERLKKIEEALGFKLFTWQKTFITQGVERRNGKTTAECLRILLDVNAKPYDLSMPAKSLREDFFRQTLRELQVKLSDAEIQTRTIFWNVTQKAAYYSKDERKEDRYNYIAIIGNYALSSNMHAFSTKELADEFVKYFRKEKNYTGVAHVFKLKTDEVVLKECDL